MPKQYRAKAQREYGDRARDSNEPDETNKFRNVQDRLVLASADNEQGLADKYDDAVAEQAQSVGATLAGEEERVLRLSRCGRHHAMKRFADCSAAGDFRHRGDRSGCYWTPKRFVPRSPDLFTSARNDAAGVNKCRQQEGAVCVTHTIQRRPRTPHQWTGCD